MYHLLYIVEKIRTTYNFPLTKYKNKKKYLHEYSTIKDVIYKKSK